MTAPRPTPAIREHVAQWRSWLVFGLVLGCVVRLVMGVPFQ